MLDLSMLLDWRMWLMVLLVALMGGCIVEGSSRKLTVGFGTTITVEDEVEPNSDGENVYHVGLDDDGRSLLDKLMGPPAPQDAKAEVPDEPTP